MLKLERVTFVLQKENNICALKIRTFLVQYMLEELKIQQEATKFLVFLDLYKKQKRYLNSTNIFILENCA